MSQLEINEIKQYSDYHTVKTIIDTIQKIKSDDLNCGFWNPIAKVSYTEIKTIFQIVESENSLNELEQRIS